MSKIVILNRKKIQFYTVIAVVVIMAGAYFGWQQSKAAVAPLSNNVQVLQLVTGEFTSTADGQKLESYRWDPGTVVVHKNEPVELRISGINGQSHPFVIEGLSISGEVHRGKTTIIRFTPKNAGIYPIICTTHADPNSGGPMVGYLVVQ
jgi:heme/copper-type cytochrome/quinol oxidase subunit 2